MFEASISHLRRLVACRTTLQRGINNFDASLHRLPTTSTFRVPWEVDCGRRWLAFRFRSQLWQAACIFGSKGVGLDFLPEVTRRTNLEGMRSELVGSD